MPPNSDHSVLQKDERCGASIFNISYYKTLKKYFIFLGQSPSQTDLHSNINATLVICINVSILLPSVFQMQLSLSKKDWDGVIESQPHLITAALAIVKLLNLHLNRQNFKELFVSVKEEWEELKLADELHYLDVLTERGSKIAQLYRSKCFYVIFNRCSIGVLIQIFDLFGINSSQNYQSEVLYHITTESFAKAALWRYKIRKATENNYVTKNGGALKGNGYQDFRQCVIVHNKAIKFFEFLDNLNRKNYLIQIGLNMIGISITAFQAVVHLHEPDQFFRYCVFFAGQNFHLFILSLPGQVLLDYSLDLATN
ncbi:uncharacterized protein LOC122400920, partial [Colletes gigas]|uniref:uncharacterized protein LOC122400920 n=1 Tax=Colletes gigas TaxID=935657 RepID=UPI001C9B4AA0